MLGRSAYPHHGQRVVMGQRLMQAATDIFLGWQRIKGLDGVTRDYYVRQFHDWKGSADVEKATRTRRHAVRPILRGHPGPGARALGRPDRESPPTSARAMCSTGPSPSSQPPTPTRTSATIRRSLRPSTPGG